MEDRRPRSRTLLCPGEPGPADLESVLEPKRGPFRTSKRQQIVDNRAGSRSPSAPAVGAARQVAALFCSAKLPAILDAGGLPCQAHRERATSDLRCKAPKSGNCCTPDPRSPASQQHPSGSRRVAMGSLIRRAAVVVLGL